MPNEIKLYSFRDTGITELLRAGVPSVSVMQLADHSDLKITSIYAKHDDENLIQKMLAVTPKI